MTETPREPGSPLEELRHIGDPGDFAPWADGNPDYVADLGLRAEDVPALIELARQWLAQGGWPEDESDEAGYAPVHAWRALGQLRAVEAVEPLLALMQPLHEADDDWYLSEVGEVFGLIGPAALEPVAAYLDDERHRLFPRATAADALYHIGERYPEARADAIEGLTRTLARFEDNEDDLNAFVIGALVRLKAVEAAELIERAYAANRVDDTIIGTWGRVRDELGVPGMGLAPDKPPRAEPLPRHVPKPHVSTPPGRVPEDPKARRARRKRERQARKQNRRRKKKR